MKSETRNCQNCKCDFVIEQADFNFYEKMKVPAPTFCSKCRLQRRLIFRNEHTLYKSVCGLCKKNTISIYSPDYKYPVYCSKCWYSDKWDPMQYGFDFDFSISFFEQFKKLMTLVPRPALDVVGSVNCEFNNSMSNSKNCYLCFRVHRSQDMLYTYRAKPSSFCTDCFGVFNSTWLYGSVECVDCTNSKYLEYSSGCVESFFLYNCRNCMSCFMCSSLRNKQYCFKNQQLSKEEYKKRISEIDFGSYEVVQANLLLFKKMKEGAIRKSSLIIKSNNVTGDNIRNSNNCRFCFDVADTDNGAYLLEVLTPSKDIMDENGGGRNELVYESSIAHSSNCKFCLEVADCRNIIYSNYCEHNHDLFGCIGLMHKQYCIFNKQYKKEEYEKLVVEITKQMNDIPYIGINNIVYKYGESLPSELSPFAYNESAIQEYFPLNEKEAVKKGYNWKNSERRNYQITIQGENLADNIKDVEDSILNEFIGCEHNGNCPRDTNFCGAICTSSFKIVLQELDFYRKMNIPLPHLCPNCRHYDRLKQKNPIELWDRYCDKCNKDIKTNYAPERPEIVYCEQCYNQEVY